MKALRLLAPLAIAFLAGALAPALVSAQSPKAPGSGTGTGAGGSKPVAPRTAGGTNPGPGDVVPIPAGPAAAGPSAPSTPLNSTGSAPSTPGPCGGCPGGAAGTVAGPGAVTTGPGSEPDPSTWRTWWEQNNAPLLDLKPHAWAPLPSTNSTNSAPSLRPGELLVRLRVVPALLEILERARDPELTEAALFSLARLAEECDPALQSRIRAAIAPALAHSNQLVVESAVLALGATGTDASAPELARLCAGQGASELLGRQTVPERVRAFATYGLALLGNHSRREDVRRYVVHHLAQGLQHVDFAGFEVDAACALGLGLVPLDVERNPAKGESYATSSRQAQIAVLLDTLRSKDAHRSVRAHAATAIGLLLQGGPSLDEIRERAVDELLDLLSRKRRADAEVVQSAALALGHVGDSDSDPLDQRIREGLAGATGLPDPQARSFALVALAEAGGRRGLGEDPDTGVRFASAHLQEALERGRSGDESWAGLALGLLARRASEARLAVGPEVGRALRKALATARSSQDRTALCVATGLARDVASEAQLADLFLASRDPEVRGYAALALGLIDARGAAVPLRSTIEQAAAQPFVLQQAATALVLMEDKEIAGLLLERVRTSSSLEELRALYRALGTSGDARAVEPLIELARDDARTAQSRALAVRALGEVADSSRLPWSTPLSVGLNYRAETDSYTGAHGIAAVARL